MKDLATDIRRFAMMLSRKFSIACCTKLPIVLDDG